MKQLIIITPVKDSIDLTLQTVEAVLASDIRVPFVYRVYNDFSTPENTARLEDAAGRLGFELVNLSDVTDHPSPNYRLVLQMAQADAIKADAGLLIIESDVVVKKDTIQQLYEGALERPDCGIAAAVTVDEQENVNFPYLFARKREKRVYAEKKRFSFCCSLLTLDFLKRISDQKAMIALELRAQYLQLKQPDSPEAIAAWNNAGASGSLEAMRFLGNYEYKKKNFKKAAAYRQVFLKTDAQQRNRDLNEIAWGDFFTCYDWSESSGGARFEIYSGMSSEEAQRLSKLIP